MEKQISQVKPVACMKASFYREECKEWWSVKPDNRDVARYVSDTTVLEEALSGGRLIRLYWSATGLVRDKDLTHFLPDRDPLFSPLHVFELEIDGQSLHNRWDWVSASERPGLRPGTMEAFVELRHQVRPVSVKVVTRMDGSPIIARWLEITNTGESPSALSHVSPWSGILWDTAKMVENPALKASPSFDEKSQPEYSVGHLGEQVAGDFKWFPITGEHYRAERGKGRTHSSPYFVARNEITGELFFIALAWSGNYFAEWWSPFSHGLAFRAGPLGPSPLRVLAPKETISSPEIHIGPLHCDIDVAVERWYQHLRGSVVPVRPAGKEMYTSAGRIVQEPGEWILREIDIAAELGIEAFMVDANWYGDRFEKGWAGERGDWHEAKWLPEGGLDGISEYTRRKGMLFGLWMEPEAVGTESRLIREHPDWVLSTDNGRRCGPTLNLANPEVTKYVENSVIKVIRDFKLDFYKIDYNVVIGEGGQNLRAGYAEHEAWRHYETLYGIFDRVRREFPLLALENSAGGGGRNDLGMMSRFHYACESDCGAFPYSLLALNTLTLFLPPEALVYYHNHYYFGTNHSHQQADLDTFLRVTLFATPVFVGFGSQEMVRCGVYFSKTRRYVELAKTFCRPVMANHPSVFHHTPYIGASNPGDWCVLEYALPDKSRGYAGIFKLSGETRPSEYIFYPRGIDLSREYEVTMDNKNSSFKAPGKELMSGGVKIRLERPHSSELILYSALGI